MDDLDRLRGQSKWADAEHLAKLLLASHNVPVASVTIAEAETFLALTGSNPVSDSVSPLASPKLATATQLLSEVVSDETVDLELACASAHLLLLNGDPQAALQTLPAIKTGDIRRDYHRVIAVKNRALMGAALVALGRVDDAITTFRAIEVSDQTLQAIPEAARWAEIMYNAAIETTASLAASPDHLVFLRTYAYVLQMSGIVGRKQHLVALDSLLAKHPQTAPIVAERDDIASLLAALPEPTSQCPIGVSSKRHHTAGAVLTPSVSRRAEPTEKAKAPEKHHHGLLSKVFRHHHHSDGNKAPAPSVLAPAASAARAPPRQLAPAAPAPKAKAPKANGVPKAENRRARAHRLEQEALQLVDDWRADAELHEPFGLVLGEDRQKAQQLQAKIIDMTGRTFNSAVLMRLNTELLYSLGDLVEAKAAFNTYVMLQSQQLLKQTSGAESSPDTDAGVAKVFSQRASVIETMPNTPYGYEIVDAAAELRTQLQSVMPQHDLEAISAAHGVLARCATMEAIRAEGNDYYNSRLEVARGYYDKALADWEGDLPFHRARAQFLLFTQGPAATFEHIQGVLGTFPNDITLINELIVSLTAQEQFDTALKIAELTLESNPPQAELTGFERTQYINLKKSHVAILETLNGIQAALEELPAVMDLATTLFPAAAILSATGANGTANGAAPPKANGKANGKAHVKTNGTKETKSSASSSSQGVPQRRATAEFTTDEPAHGFTVDLLSRAGIENSKHPADLIELWIWIASLYTRAGQPTEAQAAINVAAESGRTANVICAEAYLVKDPHDQFVAFQRAHSYDPMSLRAVLGLANVLSENTVITDGQPAPGAQSKVCETTEEELDIAQALVSTLEDMTTRALGRQTPEAWYLLGTLYSALGDHGKARKALWQCVGVEEKTGVRHIIPSLQL